MDSENQWGAYDRGPSGTTRELAATDPTMADSSAEFTRPPSVLGGPARATGRTITEPYECRIDRRRGPPTGASAAEPVPPPIDSDLHDVVPSGEQVVLDSIELGAKVAVEERVTASVISLEPVEIEAWGPGEVGGPAVALTVSIDNRTDGVLDLSSVTFTAADRRGHTSSSSQ